GIEEPEQKWPATNGILAPDSFSATDTACYGSHASSPTSSLSFLPIKPGPALKSAMNCSAPFFICVPNAALLPVIGPATAMVMSWAKAAVVNANEAPNARPANLRCFIRLSLQQAPKRISAQDGSHFPMVFGASHRQSSGFRGFCRYILAQPPAQRSG